MLTSNLEERQLACQWVAGSEKVVTVFEDAQLEKEYQLAMKLERLADSMLAGHFVINTDFQRLAFAFASKSAKTYRGVLRLAEAGLGEPSLILIRSIFEDLVNLRYINSDPEGLVELFLDFHILEKKKYFDYWEEAALDDSQVQELKKVWESEFESRYEQILKNYPKRTYWSGKNLKEMAKSVDIELLRTYCSLYPYVSGFAHGGSPLALASYVDQAGENGMTSLAAPSTEEVSEALVAGFGLLIRCLSVFADVCGLDQTELDSLSGEADKLLDEQGLGL